MKSEEDKRKYIQEFEEKEGITLNEENIKFNMGLRSLAKLALNSFYGKFSQRVYMSKCVFLTQVEDIYKLIMDYSKKVSNFHVIYGNLIVMEYTKSNEFMEVNNRTNVTVATFCTSYARMKLWKLMHRLEGQILYHDTDSHTPIYLTNYALKWRHFWVS